jgi:hypothetical protein
MAFEEREHASAAMAGWEVRGRRRRTLVTAKEPFVNGSKVGVTLQVRPSICVLAPQSMYVGQLRAL